MPSMASAAGQAAPQQVQVAPGNAQGGDQELILQALKQGVQSSVDDKGFVDFNQLVQIWPQIAQQLGLNIPFETVMQMISQNPGMIQDMIVQMGLAGITVDGKQFNAEQLEGIGSGATA